MNSIALQAVLEDTRRSAPQLYSDLDQNLAWSWNNYWQVMGTACQYIAGDINNPVSLIWIKKTQEHNPSVQAQFDQGVQSFGAVFWLLMLTTAPGSNFDFMQVDNLVRFIYQYNINGLNGPNGLWGHDP